MSDPTVSSEASPAVSPAALGGGDPRATCCSGASGPPPAGAGARQASQASGLRVEVVRLDAGVPLPAPAHPGDAGLDLHSTETLTLPPGGRALVPTGVAVAIPEGHAGLVLPRSGLALRAGVTVLNAPGLIDAGYRGELKVLLVNHDPRESAAIARGDRIAQLVIVAVARAALVEAAALPPTERGSGGFGSTGA